VPATVGAGLRLPVGLAKDNNADLLIVDLGANALRRIVSTQTQLPVSDPQIGTVWIVVDPTSGTPSTTLTPVTSSVFNNDVVVAILAENGTETFYTRDGTEPGSANGTSPPPYQNGLPVMPTSILDQTQPNAPADVTLKAISTAAGRRSSAVVTARFQFQVANPAIIGSNPGAVSLECATTNAVLYYTTDGSEPSADSFVYTFGTRLNIVNGTNDVVLKVRGFKNGYAASRLVAQTFVYNNLQTSSIGIPRDFVAGVGSTLVVPVDVRLNADDVLQSLQFRVEITPSAGAPLISDQLRVLPIDPAVDFLPITPPSTNAPATFVYTNTSASGLLIGYFGTNSALYVAANATVAMLAVPIPTTATEGQTYTMSVLYPSATSDGLETPIVLAALANRTITVSNLSYTVGDTAQSTFYNAGDFGNGNLNNNDVNNAFYAAIGIRVPYSFSDIFDAMDAYPSDTVSAVGGNGLITFLDWQAILFRSLRYDTNNWKRSRSAGGLRVVASSTLSSAPLLPAESVSASADGGSLWSPNATITGGVLEQAQPGQSVSVPVMIKVQAGAEVSGLNFLALVVPDINSSAAAVLERPRFVPASGIPAPSLSASLPGGVGCGWMLSSFRPALVGQRLLGHVEFTVPATAQPGQAYLVRFRGVDGSTVKLDGSWANYLFDSVPGVVWVQSGMLRPPTAISDQWKERFFGKVSNVLADAFADPDGDGKNNLEEFLAGTHPASLRFHALTDEWRANLNQFKLKWFGAAGKRYVIESTTDPVNGPWEPVTQFVLGEGNLIEVGAPKLDLKALFYRVREFTP
jgi:hypothetical protein